MKRLRSRSKEGLPLFYLLCGGHFAYLYDNRKDLIGLMYDVDEGARCDYARCKFKAVGEYFPNLVKPMKKIKGKRIKLLKEQKEFSA